MSLKGVVTWHMDGEREIVEVLKCETVSEQRKTIRAPSLNGVNSLCRSDQQLIVTKPTSSAPQFYGLQMAIQFGWQV